MVRGDLFFARNLGLHGMGTGGRVAGIGDSLTYYLVGGWKHQTFVFVDCLFSEAALLRLASVENQYNTDLHHHHPLFLLHTCMAYRQFGKLLGAKHRVSTAS